MPTYSYICDDCGHTLEIRQSMKEEPLCYCPSCCEKTFRRVIGTPGFELKGRGWYKTDFKDPPKPIKSLDELPKAINMPKAPSGE